MATLSVVISSMPAPAQASGSASHSSHDSSSPGLDVVDRDRAQPAALVLEAGGDRVLTGEEGHGHR
jgi:hypothetical protein